ncbi:UDP-glucuronosyl and UDP-glucosyl transferase [Handroanthus impetiginosus]|uniref:Glycosyltransferase n=1 Tax=Handroanthus impetiginosus TaxID=429701 RepID=A0A2G9HUD1_9LAMI|nr:UDP-glucuronosyl and UDP-glucosyl transferase [Handroanthus impetiginosus]
MGEQHHIVMLPFMAQGHLIPFLALANQIHKRFGFTITIATTPLNVRYLTAAIANNSTKSSKINVHELPFNSCDHGLPPNTENTEALPLNQIINLFHASTSLEIPFRGLIDDIIIRDGSPPLCIISDVFMGWANDVAKSYGTLNVTFTGGAYGTTAYTSIWQHLPHRLTKNDEFNLPGYPDSCRFHITQMHRFLRAADGTDSWSRFFQPQIGYSLKSFGWLCNTAEEIEPFGLDVFRKYTKAPVWCIGPLIPPSMLNRNSSSRVIEQHAGRKPGISPEKCLQWLDLHSQNSILYISFGSQNTISASQMMALAHGLEDSKRPFIWVIRPPIGFNLRGEFKSEWLPTGFEERISKDNQGLLVKDWAPQLDVLCHKSTGAFMSHCGWNSIMESLSQGVPMIGWPLAAEQGYNAKMLVEEMGVCVEITRGVQSNISRDEVKKVIETAMGKGDKAKEMKKQAEEIGELIRAAMSEEGNKRGSSYKAMDDFVTALVSNGKGLA